MHLWWKTYLFRFQKYRRLSVPPECVSWIASQSNRGSLSVSTYCMPHSIVNCTNMYEFMMIPTHIDNANLNSHQSCEILLAKDSPPFQIFQNASISSPLTPNTKCTLSWIQKLDPFGPILIMTWKQILSWTDNRRDNLVMRLQFLCWFFFVDWTLDYLPGIIYPSLDHQRKWSVDYI